MARVRITEQCELKSWEDVDLYLAEISEKERDIEKIEADMQAAIEEMKLTAADKAKTVRDRIEHLAGQIKLYTDGHTDDMSGKKTKALTFGQIGYRKSTKVILPKAKAKIDEIIQALKARGMSSCVITPPEKINKDVLKQYPEADVKAVGASLKVQDVFWYETSREKLKEEF